MQSDTDHLFELEKRFWQSMVEEDADTAVGMLAEPALMVSSHGSMAFDHAGYRKMAEQGAMVLASFELDDLQAMFPASDTAILTYKVHQTLQKRGQPGSIEQDMVDSSVWLRKGRDWRCVMHTETPMERLEH